MADLKTLQQQRAQIKKELDRRGGASKAPGFAKQLEDIDAQIKAAQSGGGGFVLGTDLATLQQQKANSETQIEKRGGNAPNYQDRLNQINIAIDRLSSSNNPPAVAPEVPPAIPAPNPIPIAAPPNGAIPEVSLPPGQQISGPFDPGGAIQYDVPNSGYTDVTTATGGIKDSQTAQNAELVAAENRAQRNLQLNNPNQIGPTGTTQYTVDENGNIIQTNKLSENQQQILNQGERLTQGGQQLAIDRMKGLSSDFNPNLTPRTATGNLEADRARIEDALYAKMTRDLDRNQAVDQKKIEQSLFNKGIAYNDNPDSRYQTELRNNLKRYDTARENARQSAIQSGGDELARSVGIGETLRANDYAQQLGIRGQNLGEISTLANQGLGYIPQTPLAFSGAQYNPNNPLDTYGTITTLGQTQQQINDARAKAEADRALQEKLQKEQNATSLAISRLSHGGSGRGSSSTSRQKVSTGPTFP